MDDLAYYLQNCRAIDLSQSECNSAVQDLENIELFHLVHSILYLERLSLSRLSDQVSP